MPHMLMDHADDPRDAILAKIGDISSFELFHNQVLVATYMRPPKTKSGLHLPESHIKEDAYQGKVGLLLKAGPTAFVADEHWFNGLTFTPEQDWLLYRPSDGWACSVNGVLCRIFDDILIKGRVPHPDVFF